jgi:hypothetical protein
MFTRFQSLLRNFSKSSSVGLVKLSPKDKLSKRLKEEMALQKDNYQSAEDLLIDLQSKGFTLSDSLNSEYIKLSKQLEDNRKLIICIDSEPFIIPPENLESEEFNETNEDGTPSINYLVSFEVSILNADQSKAISMECKTIDFKLSFMRIMHLENLPFDSHGSFFNHLIDYKGPPIDNLKNSIKECYQDYLISLGFDHQLLMSITLLSYDKQRKLYLIWMKNIRNMLSN